MTGISRILGIKVDVNLMENENGHYISASRLLFYLFHFTPPLQAYQSGGQLLQLLYSFSDFMPCTPLLIRFRPSIMDRVKHHQLSINPFSWRRCILHCALTQKAITDNLGWQISSSGYQTALPRQSSRHIGAGQLSLQGNHVLLFIFAFMVFSLFSH